MTLLICNWQESLKTILQESFLKNLTNGTLRAIVIKDGAGWSSLEARRAHNPKVVGSNPTPATTALSRTEFFGNAFFIQ